MSSPATPPAASTPAPNGATPTSQDAVDAPKRRLPLLLLLIIVGAGLGTGAGHFGLAPVLMARKDQAAVHAREAAEKQAAAEAVVVSFDNLVLNPAGSEGARFLMVSAGIQVRGKSAEDALKARTTEVRDRMLDVLGRKTVAQLTDMRQRNGIKTEVLSSIASMFPKGDVQKLYFPQFVLQ